LSVTCCSLFFFFLMCLIIGMESISAETTENLRFLSSLDRLSLSLSHSPLLYGLVLPGSVLLEAYYSPISVFVF
jgi:hypothetical protein